MQPVNCQHAKDTGSEFSVHCSIGMYLGSPSFGTCSGCPKRKPINPEEPALNLATRLKYKAEANISNDPTLKTTMTIGDKLKATLPVLSAVMRGKEVSYERQEKRLEVCSNCSKLSMVDNQIGCGVCGCELAVKDKSILNLISLEETDSYGCFFYGKTDRSKSKWKEAGV